MSGSIKEILTRYITNTATAEDLKLLDDWVKSPSNQEELKAFIKDYYTIAHSINNPNTDHAVHKLLSSIKKRDGIPYRRMRGHFLKYAAAIFIMGILLSTYIFREDLFNQNLATPPAHEIKVGTDKAILTLADGSEIQLGEKEVYEADDFGSNGKSLEYFGNKKGKSKHAATVAYHFLTVPRGGKFMITLSDGTKVWLNSDSRLKYPTKFKEGESRMVELVYGEAYFDVSPAANNQGADFKVYNNNQEVKVLGTEFNIKAYVDDKDVLTTLVEGKINLKVEDEEQILLPGQQAKYDALKNRIVTKSIDVYNETSWKDGIFSFDNKPLHEIMKVLSRWYDVDIKFINEEIEDEEFVGVLSKNQEIEEILSQIKNTGLINNYKIENNEVNIE